MSAPVCSPLPFYALDRSTRPPTLRVDLETSCGSPDRRCTHRGLSFETRECRSCGGSGIVDNGGGH